MDPVIDSEVRASNDSGLMSVARGYHPDSSTLEPSHASPSQKPRNNALAAASSSDGRAVDNRQGWLPDVTSPSSITSPVYWQSGNNSERRASPSLSDTSVESVPAGGGITMRDNEISDRDGRNKACWAKSVEITDYVVVNGSAANIGAFVVWNIRVETLQVS